MLSSSVHLRPEQHKSTHFVESKAQICALAFVMGIMTLMPFVMLATVTILPEGGVPGLFSWVDHKHHQSHAPRAADKCDEEDEMFQSWHELGWLEQYSMQNNSVAEGIQREEPENDSSPELLNIDPAGRIVQNISINQSAVIPEAAYPPRTDISLGKGLSARESRATKPTLASSETISGKSDDQVGPAEASKHLLHPILRWKPSATKAARKEPEAGFMKRREIRNPMTVMKDEVRFAHWVDRVPKVACIMAVPPTSRAQARLKYAVNNFRAQNYLGDRQLILVHHFQDRRGLGRIQQQADGVYVKAVVARAMEVPSSMALRYGAWAADDDVDVVVRWDIDSYHHPQRLEMQVRALALTGQSACLLKRWTQTRGDDERSVVTSELGWEGSLVGERGWMKHNWHPFMEGSHALHAERGSLVHLDMPELSVQHLESDAKFVESSM